jgi:hypothetical protein
VSSPVFCDLGFRRCRQEWGWAGSRAVLLTGTPLPCHRSISIVADGRFGVCDGAHWAFVMKKVKGPALRFAIGRATRPRSF